MLEIWNDDRITELKKLFSEGYSAGNIGTAMGLSRNSVIGKLFRLKLKRDTPPRVKRVRVPRAPKTRSGEHHAVTRIVRSNGNSNSMRVVRSVETARYKLRCIEIVPLGLSIIELEANNCRYPYGDETITFCGHPIKEKSSYCISHHYLCWEAPRPPNHRAFIRAAA